MKFQVPVPDMRGARAARIWMYANQANHLNQVNHLVDNLLLTIRRLLGDLLVEWVVRVLLLVVEVQLALSAISSRLNEPKFLELMSFCDFFNESVVIVWIFTTDLSIYRCISLVHLRILASYW
jgi:hypothetical protein